VTTYTDLAVQEHPAPGAPLPAIPALRPDQLQLGLPGEVIRDQLLQVITGAITAHPRSQQKRIGPSEMGTPCARKLGYKLAGHAEAEREPAWRPTIGTAVHAWLAEQFVGANMDAWPAADAVQANALVDGLGPMTLLDPANPDGPGRPFTPPTLRYAVECTVNVGEVDGTPITGSCDLYDRVTATVVDWKVVGTSTLRKVKAHGPGPTYRAQAHLYGRGWRRRGVPCERVAVMFLPNSGELTDAVWWSEPWDEQVALDALARADAIAAGIRVLGAGAMLANLPAVDDYCRSCPFRVPGSTDLSVGCPGAAPPPAPVSAVPSASQFLLGGAS